MPRTYDCGTRPLCPLRPLCEHTQSGRHSERTIRAPCNDARTDDGPCPPCPLRPLCEINDYPLASPRRFHAMVARNQHGMTLGEGACSVRAYAISHQHESIKKTSPRPLRPLCEINEIPPTTAYTVAGGIVVVITPCWQHRPWLRRRPFGLLRRGSMRG